MKSLKIKPAPFAALHGDLRRLVKSEIQLLREHLLRLDSASRLDRFNGIVSNDFVESYAAKSLTDGTFVIGYVVGESLRGTAALHPPASNSVGPEVAFSVEDEFRRLGMGTLLFQNIIAEPKEGAYRSPSIMTGSENKAMKPLAKKFGVRFCIQKGEAIGTLSLLEENLESLVPSVGDVDRDRERWSAL